MNEDCVKMQNSEFTYSQVICKLCTSNYVEFDNQCIGKFKTSASETTYITTEDRMKLIHTMYNFYQKLTNSDHSDVNLHKVVHVML